MRKVLLMLAAIAAFCISGVAQTAHHNDLKWSWSQGTGAAAKTFNVKVGTVSGGPYSVLSSVPVTQLSFSDTSANLTDGSTHFYVITAVAADGTTESSPSNEVKLTTPFLAPPPVTGASGTAF